MPKNINLAWTALPAFVVEAHTSTEVEALPRNFPRTATLPKPRSRVSWLRRLFGVRERQTRSKRQLPALPPATPTAPPLPPSRLDEKLTSPQTLLLGNDWSLRRRDLERRVITELPGLLPADRAALWADLAAVCHAIGDADEAAICSRNAAWDKSGDEMALDDWLRAECRAAKVPAPPTAAKLLNATDPVSVARVATAFLAMAGATSFDSGEAAALLQRVDAAESDLSSRAVWLARVGVARRAGGDPLGLACARDRIFTRLRDKGPGLDLDAPAFLRFRGVPTGDRLTLARDWLLGAREPIRRWLGKLGTPGRLQWAGIDGEDAHTAAYADLMLAWAFGKLGDRGHAKSLETSAARLLGQPPGRGADPRVHAHLLALFRERIRQAQDGRCDPGEPSLTVPDSIEPLGRYAIDSFRKVSRVLEPDAVVDPFEGRDSIAFIGSDMLGRRLAEFLRPRDGIRNPADARRLLALDAAESTAATMPRVIFALLEAAPSLDPSLVAAVIPQTVRAIDLIPEWKRLAGLPGDPAAVASRFGRRMLLAACHAATLFRLAPSLRAATEDLIDRCDTPDGPAARLFEPVAGPYFRALARLGLEPFAALLVARFRAGEAAGPRELGLAVGHFAAGNTDTGNAILDAARQRLFVAGVRDERERTTMAMAYAAALAHASPRLALGRLEELFRRLDMVTATGATNRYFTLAPLALIDVALRAVVGDDFTLSSRVRGWLDDDEYLTRRRITRDLAEALRDQ